MRTEFYAWRKKARASQSPHFLCYSLPSVKSRVAVVIPSKKIRLASERNFLRRRLLDVALPHARQSSLDVVLFLKSPSSTQTLLSELTTTLPKIHYS